MGVKDKIENDVKSILNVQDGLKGSLGLLEMLVVNAGKLVMPFSEVQHAASELARTAGLASSSIMNIATRTVEQNKRMQLSMTYNISSPEMIKIQSGIMAQLGRNVVLDQVGTVGRNANGELIKNFDSELENVIAAYTAFSGSPETINKMIVGYDKIGMSAKAAAKAAGKLFHEASEYGINLQAYAKNFTENLEMAQMYNFRNGVNGLKEMARKATEIRQDMRQVANFADRVSTVTGAVETAAQLQVLGGSFAAFSNPFAMLNEGLTNMEALEERFSKMSMGAAKYNPNTRQIEMDPATRLKMKRAAEVMGVDPSKFIDQAYAQARRSEIKRQMTGIGNLTPDFAKLIQNVGTIDTETGAAGVSIGDKFYSLGDIASMSAKDQEKLQNDLVAQNKTQSEDIKDIAKSVLSIQEHVTGNQKQLQNAAAWVNIQPGTINGTSSWDFATNYLTQRFTPSIISAASKIDVFTDSLRTGVITEAFTAIEKGIETFKDFDNPEKFKESIKSAVNDIFGPGASGAGEALGDLGSWVSKTSNKLNEYTVQQANFNIMPGYTTTVHNGIDGRETPLTPVEGTATASVAMAANDVVLQASHLSLNGENPTMPSIVLSVNPATMEGQVVSAPRTTESTGGGGTSVTGEGSYNLNLSGNLTMNVRYTDGKDIGTLDIMKLLEEDAGFKRELANAISAAIADMEARRG